MTGLGIVLGMVGFVVILVGSVVDRDYRRAFAQANSDLPGWFWWFDPDADPDVERLRRRARNLSLLALLIFAVALALIQLDPGA